MGDTITQPGYDVVIGGLDISVDTPELLCGLDSELIDGEWSTAVIRYHDVTTPIIGPFREWMPPIPYSIKNQRGASKIPSKLVLYGIRELA